MKVMVVGARPGSLGDMVKVHLRADGHQVVTAGLGEETVYMDLVSDSMGQMRKELVQHRPDHIVCTAGVNQPWSHWPSDDDPGGWYRMHLEVNCLGPMRLLEAWCDVLREERGGRGEGYLSHYVVIGSNSARVPRSDSAAYCASKAALAQAVRCKARELRGGDALGLVAYGYEPGLLAGTPMTTQTARDFPGVPLTRMRGEALAEGVSAGALALMVSTGLSLGPGMNGCMIPFDANEG